MPDPISLLPFALVSTRWRNCGGHFCGQLFPRANGTILSPTKKNGKRINRQYQKMWKSASSCKQILGKGWVLKVLYSYSAHSILIFYFYLHSPVIWKMLGYFWKWNDDCHWKFVYIFPFSVDALCRWTNQNSPGQVSLQDTALSHLRADNFGSSLEAYCSNMKNCFTLMLMNLLSPSSHHFPRDLLTCSRLSLYYGLNCVPPNPYSEGLTPQCDYMWR